VMVACWEQAIQSCLLPFSRTVRKRGLLYAEYIKSVGGVSALASGCLSFCCRCGTRILMASIAIRMPMTPTTGPKIPPSPHVVTLSGGGGFGNTQR